MPIIKSAKKKLRQDKKRAARNVVAKTKVKEAVKSVKKTPTKEGVSKAYSALDQAVKKKIIHKNKAARIKSQITRPNGKS